MGRKEELDDSMTALIVRCMRTTRIPNVLVVRTGQR